MLSQRVALIAGASGGIGRALADRYSKAGYAVIAHYFRHRDRATSLCREIGRAGRSAFALAADLRRAEQVARLVELAIERFGRIDLLVNAAGTTRDRPLLRMPEPDWDEVIAAHLTGAFYLIRSVARSMRKSGGGQIINIGSLAAKRGRIGQANYTAAKAGLIALTQSAARELAPFNIRVNVVLPGIQPTGAFLSLSPSRRKELLEENLLGRSTSLEELCAFVVHLSSMSSISGQVFNLDSRVA